ncbi:type I toxin-antitoxin system Fst family toxin [Staphylococcus muscae]|nr:type I toxin-antitoxin system Fst family toxin [Staphylococcus muscae]
MTVISIVYCTLLAPIIVGIVLATYKHWLSNRKR